MRVATKINVRILLLMAILLFVKPLTIVGEEALHLNSDSVILIDATTGDILYEKNSEQLMYPASITKIVTGIIAIEQGNLNDIVTVSENARYTNGTRVYLEIGEKVTLEKLVQGLLINSGNDAGVAIAEHMDGNVEQFAERMNQFVREIVGVEQTTFTNPHGLFHPDHVTTAYDMAKITQYAMQNDIFRQIVSTKHIEWKGESWDTTLYNHHQLVRQRDDVIGVKNGFVNQSGFTLVTAAEQDHIQLIAVTLNADTNLQSYDDTTKLLDYGFETFQTNHLTHEDVETLDTYNEYFMSDDYFFTSQKDTNWDKDIENGHLIVTDEDGETLFKQKLSKKKIDESLGQALNIADESDRLEQGKEMNLPLIIIISLLCLVIVGVLYLFIQKQIRKRRRFFN